MLQHRIRRHEHQRRREQVPRQAGRARHRRRGLLWRSGEQANPEPTPVAVGAVGGSCCRASRRSPPHQPLQSLALAAPPSDGCTSMRARRRDSFNLAAAATTPQALAQSINADDGNPLRSPRPVSTPVPPPSSSRASSARSAMSSATRSTATRRSTSTRTSRPSRTPTTAA